MVNNKFRILITFGVGYRGRRWEVCNKYVLSLVLFYSLYLVNVFNTGRTSFKTSEPKACWVTVKDSVFHLPPLILLSLWRFELDKPIKLMIPLILFLEGQKVTLFSLLSSPPVPHWYSEKPSFSLKSFQFYNIFILTPPFQGLPELVFLEREKQKERGLLSSLQLGAELGSTSHKAFLLTDGIILKRGRRSSFATRPAVAWCLAHQAAIFPPR